MTTIATTKKKPLDCASDKHLKLAREIAAPAWELEEHDPVGFDKWIAAIAYRLDLFEKDIRKET